MLKKIVIISLSIFICSIVFGQNLNPPGNWSIISDYGPRNVANSWFHYGIDYAGSEGESIKAVESGNIFIIDWDQNGGGFYIGIEGTIGYWTYLHTFSGIKDKHPLPMMSGNWELRNTTLEKPANGNNYTGNIIILWSGNYPQKVLSISDYSSYWIKDSSGNYLLDSSGNKITTQSTVSA
ncbi:MAG: M23 family metallopeptidase, partial [Elusimicrobia bacterium]|nr:M23 family metallopeptidase [Candidatus Liberimonas magnetica]